MDTPDTPEQLPGHDLHVELEVHRGAAGTVHVVRLAGDLELPTAPRLDAALGVTPQGRRPGRAPSPESGAEPPAAPPDAVVLDLTEVTFIDSTGLGAVLKAYRRVRDAGGTFVLVGPPEQTRALLEVTGATHVIPVHPTLASALAELLHPSA